MKHIKIKPKNLTDYDYLKDQIVKVRNNTYSMLNTSLVQVNEHREQGLFIARLPKPSESYYVLLSALHETIQLEDYQYHLSVRKQGDCYKLSGLKYLSEIKTQPYPKFIYSFGMMVLQKEILLSPVQNVLFIRYKLLEAPQDVQLILKPLLAFRDINSLSHANNRINHEISRFDSGIGFRIYTNFPSLYFMSDKTIHFIPKGRWIKNIELHESRKESNEDLYNPGEFRQMLKAGESVIFATGLDLFTREEIKNAFEEIII